MYTLIARPEKPPPYQYFSTPEGQEVDKKFISTLKYSSYVALGIGITDVMTYSKPVGYAATLRRFAYVTAPIVGLTGVFVLTTNSLASFRQKDDCYNWTVGGAVVGGLLGAYRKNQRLGWSAFVGFAILATLRKLSIENGYFFVPPNIHTQYGNATTARWDFSLYEDKPGEWRKRYEE